MSDVGSDLKILYHLFSIVGRDIELVDKNFDELKKVIASLYLDENVVLPTSSYYLIKHGQSFGGAHEGGFKKGITTDVDGVVNIGKEIWRYWIDGMCINKRVERKDRILKEMLESIPRTKSIEERDRIINLFGKELLECRLHRMEYEKAASYAAENLELTPYFPDFISELRMMGYEISLNSGSPQECIKSLAREILGIPSYSAFGSIYKFDEYGYFTGEIITRLGFNKVEAMDTFLKGIGCSPNISIFITDDPDSDKDPASKAGYAILVDLGNRRSIGGKIMSIVRKAGRFMGLYDLPGETTIYCPEARKDMRLLIEPIKRCELINMLTYLRGLPEVEKNICLVSKNFKNCAEEALKAKVDFESRKNSFLMAFNSLMSILAPVFDEDSFGVWKSVTELKKTSNSVEKDKSLIKDIFNRIKERLPEINASDDLIERLDKMIEDRLLH